MFLISDKGFKIYVDVLELNVIQRLFRGFEGLFVLGLISFISGFFDCKITEAGSLLTTPCYTC